MGTIRCHSIMQAMSNTSQYGPLFFSLPATFLFTTLSWGLAPPNPGGQGGTPWKRLLQQLRYAIYSVRWIRVYQCCQALRFDCWPEHELMTVSSSRHVAGVGDCASRHFNQIRSGLAFNNQYLISVLRSIWRPNPPSDSDWMFRSNHTVLNHLNDAASVEAWNFDCHLQNFIRPSRPWNRGYDVPYQLHNSLEAECIVDEDKETRIVKQWL